MMSAPTVAGPIPNEPKAVAGNMVGEVFTDALPSEDPVLYGRADIEPKGGFEARSAQTFRLTYTVGRHGMDDTGSLRVVIRSVGDWGRFQTTDAKAPNYVTASASNGAGLDVEYRSRGGQRPRNKALTVMVTRGCLREGDTVTVIFGDTSGGSPGTFVQTFCEAGFEFKVLADVCATGHYVPIQSSPSIAVIPGPPSVWRAVLPTLRRPGESFQLGIKAEDAWGNPTDQASAKLRIKASLPVANLPETVDYQEGSRAMTFEGLSVDAPGTLTITVQDDAGKILATATPLIIREGAMGGYWADLHGQSGESIGIGASRDYFNFARDMSFLDAASHQANDFQVNNTFWAYINELTAEFHEDNRFVTFPGYEWSGNTAVGGDRNVFFREEGRQIRRSSHALLPDRSDIHTDAPNAGKLFEVLADEDVVIFAHVGGRYADIGFAHDGRLERSMELHSAWGSFEWLIEDCFDLGHRVGVVCNSDGHKGRPGASYPGASQFGAYGGLTCYLANELTRDGIFDALRRRHHYGTTGNRLHLEVHVEFAGGADLFDNDPALFDANSTRVSEVMIGDIARTTDKAVTLRVDARSGSPIERIEIRNGKELLQTVRGYSESDLGARIRVLWSGAEYRGRGRETNWVGEARFPGTKITGISKINAWNHERRLEQTGDDTVAFDAITTGNFGGFDVWLDETATARLEVESNLVNETVPLADIGLEDTIFDAGALKRRIRAYRLPKALESREISVSVPVELKPDADNPLWVCVTTEDGFQAWSSPIYVIG
jgi:hypothetical protein